MLTAISAFVSFLSENQVLLCVRVCVIQSRVPPGVVTDIRDVLVLEGLE